MYDVTYRKSFDKLNFWKEKFENNSKINTQVMLLGNKIDLSDRHISRKEGEEYAETNGLFFRETSAKTNEKDCVDEAFNFFINQIASDIIKKEREEFKSLLKKERETSLKPFLQREDKKSSCC